MKNTKSLLQQLAELAVIDVTNEETTIAEKVFRNVELTADERKLILSYKKRKHLLFTNDPRDLNR